ncbi:MAG: DUF4271 domain-containing protein [Bacteroidales bacterium]
MITSFYSQQDTVKPQLVIRVSPRELLSDSVFRRLDDAQVHLKKLDSIRQRRIARAESMSVVTDTVSVCSRNSVADITFYDSLNFIRGLKDYRIGSFPVQLAENAGNSHRDRYVITKDLKEGKALPGKPLHSDWLIVVVLIAAYLFVVIRSTTRRMGPEITRFLLLRGVNEPSSRDLSSLYYWQSTILNFASFLAIGLFAYCTAAWYGLIPSGIPQILFMLLSFGAVIFGITTRHLICRVTGMVSGHAEEFKEYLINVYQSYRIGSIILFVLSILIVYTVFLPPPVYIKAGLIVLAILYLYRVSRLLLIFLKRGISILYLILYLCALEILPVSILIKYFTGGV